jgi:hypothetical protein
MRLKTEESVNCFHSEKCSVLMMIVNFHWFVLGGFRVMANEGTGGSPGLRWRVETDCEGSI